MLAGRNIENDISANVYICVRDSWILVAERCVRFTVYPISLVNLRRSAPRLFALIWGINTPTRASPHPGLAVEGIYRRQFIVHSTGCLQGDMLNPCLCPTRRCWDMPLAPAMIRQPVSGHNEVDTQNTIYLLFLSLHGHVLHLHRAKRPSSDRQICVNTHINSIIVTQTFLCLCREVVTWINMSPNHTFDIATKKWRNWKQKQRQPYYGTEFSSGGQLQKYPKTFLFRSNH